MSSWLGQVCPGHHWTSTPSSPGSLSACPGQASAQKSDLEHPGRLVVEVALGNMASALDLLRRHPGRGQPQTCLPAQQPQRGAEGQD